MEAWAAVHDAPADRPPVTHGDRRRLARPVSSLAVVLAVVAVVAVFSTGSGGESSDDGAVTSGEVVAGLLLVFGPLLAAAVTRSVAGSTLLRRVGPVAALVALCVGAVHVGVLVDERGGAGWLLGLPALGTVVAIVAAVVVGPDRRPAVAVPAPVASAPAARARMHADDQPPAGPPLDVLGPLRAARQHALAATAAWAIVLAVGLVVTAPVLRLFGWPTIEREVRAEVVDVRPFGDRTSVTFEGEVEGRTVRWTYVLSDPGWEVGERNTAYLDEDGRVHEDRQLGLAGIPLVLPALIIAAFGAAAVRRSWGLVVAWWDVRRDGDPPRLGYAAVIEDPAPKAWRPLVAVWADDPTGGDRLARPDAVYRGDHETGEPLQSPTSRVVVRRCWIDTGAWAGAKPRWLGFEDGVAVPHRRSLFGRRYVGAVTRRSHVTDIVPLHHSAPDPRAVFVERGSGASSPRLPGMVAWRSIVLVGSLILTLRQVDEGHAVREVEPQRRSAASDPRD